MKLNKLAWEILQEDEKMVLNIQHGHNKSSWQAGEIMGKAHYKLLEIKYRATHFLKLFTTYFTLYDELIPPHFNFPKEITDFLNLSISQRLGLKQVYEILNNTYGKRKNKDWEKLILDFMESKERAKSLEIINFISLVKEFDRWNNHRILPPEIQEPSAYKRRNSKLHKKHLRLLSGLSPLALDIMNKVLFCSSVTGYYVVLIEADFTPVVKNLRKRLIGKATDFGLYIWRSREEATNHLEVAISYISNEQKGSKEGLKFWPKYRESIKSAENYLEVQNIKPSRKYLEMAVSKLQFYNHKN